MNVIVKKKYLKEALSILLEEAGEKEDDNKPVFMTDQSEDPIKPTPQMSTQLSTEMPPVDDPDYVPVNSHELSLAASVIAGIVPDDQIDFFYRKLHNLLDDAVDRDSEDPVEQEEREGETVEFEDINERLRKSIAKILSETDSGPFNVTEQDEEEASDEEVSDDEADRMLASMSDADPIQKIVDAIESLQNEVNKNKREALLSSDTARLNQIEREFDWMFYDKDQEAIAVPWLVLKSLKRQEVKGLVDAAKSSLGVEEDKIARQVIEKYRSRMVDTGPPLSQDPDLAAEMYANVLVAGMQDPEDDRQAFEKEVQEKIESVRSAGSITTSFADKKGSPPIKVEVPADKFIAALELARDRKIDSIVPAESFEEEEVDMAKLKKQYKEKEKSDRQKLADELGISYGALTNVEQDMAVALGPRVRGAATRAPRTADTDKVAQYMKMYEAILEKLTGIVSDDIVMPIFTSKHGFDQRDLSDQDVKTIKDSSLRISKEIIGYDKENMKFSNQDVKKAFDEFLPEFVKMIDKDLNSPLFDALPDYADFKTGDAEFEGREDFTDKDARETKSTAKSLSYLVRNIFNVGYELESLAQDRKAQARQASQAGDLKKFRSLSAEADEYETESLKYMTRSREIVQAIADVEIPDKMSKKYANRLKSAIQSSV